MNAVGKFEKEALEALRRAVSRALDCRRRLGQYAVFCEDGRVIFDGPDAPPGHGHSMHAGAGEAVETDSASDSEPRGRKT